MSKQYSVLRVEKKDQVATIQIQSPSGMSGAFVPVAWELSSLLNELREDNSIRIIVLTGTGNTFSAMRGKQYFQHKFLKEPGKPQPADPSKTWINVSGLIRCHQAMAEIEKPIIAKVNGDALGFGSSLVFASDLAVAREDAIIADVHLGMGEMERSGYGWGTVPGDGGCALLPLHLSPMKAKEYLFLAKTYTGRELAEMNVINYAVPAAQLDDFVMEIVTRLLKRSAHALAWTKRVVNRRVVDHLNMTLDSAIAYETLNHMQINDNGGIDRQTLT